MKKRGLSSRKSKKNKNKNKKGQRFMSKTTHSLCHIPYHVRKWGPLWTTSCLPFESFYHFCVKMIHGTRYALHQVSSRERLDERSRVDVSSPFLASPFSIFSPPGSRPLWRPPECRSKRIRGRDLGFTYPGVL